MNKQKLTLFILLILFILALGWSFYSAPRQKTVATLKYAPGQKASEIRKPVAAVKPTKRLKSDQSGDERVVRLDLLDKSASSFKGYKRNIFKPVFVDELAVMKQKAAALKILPVPQKPVVPVKQPPQQPQVASPETPRTALARFTFLGFLQKDGKKTIFLTKDKEIILVKSGERFSGGRYEVRSLTDQALTILVIENGEEIVVPLTENKPLLAAVKK